MKKFKVDMEKLMHEAEEAKEAKLENGFIPMGSPHDWPEGDDRKEDNDGFSSRESTLHGGPDWRVGLRY